MNILFNYHRPHHQPCSCQLRLQWGKCFGCAPASSVFPHFSTMNFCYTEHPDSDVSTGSFTPHCFTPSICAKKKRSLLNSSSCWGETLQLLPVPTTTYSSWTSGGTGVYIPPEMTWWPEEGSNQTLDQDLARTFWLFIILLVRRLSFVFLIFWKRA